MLQRCGQLYSSQRPTATFHHTSRQTTCNCHNQGSRKLHIGRVGKILLTMKKTYFLLAILFLASCGNGNDPTSAAKKQLAIFYERLSNGYLKVSKFTKINAIKEKRNDIDYYILNYDFELVGTKDGGYLSSKSDSDTEEIINIWDGSVSEEPISKIQVKKGQRYRVSEGGRLDVTGGFKMTLAKHENGWVMVED